MALKQPSLNRASTPTRLPQRALWIFIVAALWGHSACQPQSEKSAAEKTGGNPRRGAEAIQRHGCSACHTIPGIDGALGRTGPSLGGVTKRARIGETLDNNAENLIRWIRDPKSIDRNTSMPTLQISEPEARDIAAYLYAQE